MDYFDIVKRALKVTWRYKALWVLGFFVGGGSGGSGGGGSNYSQSFGGSGSDGSVPMENTFTELGRWADANTTTLIVVVSVLIFISILYWVLSVAAQAGLVYLVNEAEENRTVRLRDGWRVGFQRWGRTFMLNLVVWLPIFAVVVAMIAIFGASLYGFGSGGGDAAAAGGFAGICCGLPLLGLVVVVVGVVAGIVLNLGLRYAVLHDISFGQALARGWTDLTGKRGAFVFMLVMIIPGFVYGAIVGVASLVIAVPAAFMIIAGNIATGIGLLVLLVLALMVPGAAYGTFVSSAWTIFFRRVNGMELPLEVREPAPVRSDILPPPPVPAAPQPPYAPPVPPAPEPPAPGPGPSPEPPADA